MARIVIVSGLQLVSNPRVVKEADALVAAGHEVTMISALLEPAMAEREAYFGNRGWRVVRAVNAKQDGADRIRWHWQRFRHRIAREVTRRCGLQLPAALGYSPREILGLCRNTDADLYIFHNAQGLWVGREMEKRGCRVAFDFEDWYSRDLRPEDRRFLPIRLMEECEKSALKPSNLCSTTSHAMAQALAKYGGGKAPGVIHNSFPWGDRKRLKGEVRDRRDRRVPSLHWFSQTIGPGRGLEVLAEALHQVSKVMEIHLRGTCRPTYREELMARFPPQARGRLFFHPQVPEPELLGRIAEHDLCLASDLPDCPNRELTISNKILLYLLAGRPVLASRTSGHREVAVESPAGVLLYAPQDPGELAGQIRPLLLERGRRERAGAENLAAAKRKYCWEVDQPRLIADVERALGAQ
jgi:glycosyltransferase involved in cell wall biosynthesis